jgi:ATP-dependent protease HslVU (ClpYQ) ATPase subunit
VVRWKSHGDQVQIATLLGVMVAEGFIAMEAEDSTEVKNVGNNVLKLARGLGVEERALKRSRSIIELADKNEWTAARKEWDAVLADLENGMIELKSEHLSQLASLGGWLRGTEALCALVLQNYSPERADLIRQPVLVDYLEKQLLGLNREIQTRPVTAKMLKGIRKIHVLIENEKGPLTENTVREIHEICEELVRLSSRRPNEL